MPRAVGTCLRGHSGRVMASGAPRREGICKERSRHAPAFVPGQARGVGKGAAAAGMLAATPVWALGAEPVRAMGAELAPGVYADDASVGGAIVLGFVAYCYSVLGEGGAALLMKRVSKVEPLEVRLDVTTLWCFTLARELLYEWGQGVHIDLGFQPEELARLGQVAVSSSALCVLWVLAGVPAGHFERAGAESFKSYVWAGVATCLSAGVTWQVVEQYVYSPAASRPWLLEAVRLDWGAGLSSVAALALGMLSYRLFSWYVD